MLNGISFRAMFSLHQLRGPLRQLQQGRPLVFLGRIHFSDSKYTLGSLGFFICLILLAPLLTPFSWAVSFEEVRSGGSAASAIVATADHLTAIPNDLYLTAISSKPYREVDSVSGLGLVWTRLDAQCGGRSQTGVEVWAAQGTPAENGPVTATLSKTPLNAIIVVSRYSDVDLFNPIGNIVSGNTNGSDGACSGGSDGGAYTLDLTTTVPGSLGYAVVAIRNRIHRPGAGITERVEVVQGSGSSTAGLATIETSVTSPPTAVLNGTFNNDVDWALIALEIKPEGTTVPKPDISVSPISHDYRRVIIGGSAVHTFGVRNDGHSNLIVNNLALSGVGAGDFSVSGAQTPFTLEPQQSQDVTVSFNPTSDVPTAATLEIESNDINDLVVSIALAGTGAVPPSEGIWISVDELAQKPMSGPAWENVKSAADGDLGIANISDLGSKHDVRTLAVALVYARTGEVKYRQKAAGAIISAIGTEDGTPQAVAVGRNVVPYVISADLINFAEYDPQKEAQFRSWLDGIRFVVWPDGSCIAEDEERANNHGRMCGASRAAIAVYLGDFNELDRTAQVFKGLLGDRNAYSDFHWKHDLSWQADEANPVGINPVGATKNGFSIDGAFPEEMRRGCGFQIPPCFTNYPWEALQGILVEGVILSRAGYDVFNWENQAILRAVQYVKFLDEQYPGEGWWAFGDDTWSPWLINAIYNTNFPTERARIGKCMGWTDWTHQPKDSPPPVDFVITCPSDILAANEPNRSSARIIWSPPDVLGNVDKVESLTSTHAPGDRFPIGQTVVEYTAVDPAENTATCSFQIGVVFKLRLKEGWNLVSTPVESEQNIIELLKDDIIGNIWRWRSGRFEIANTLDPFSGYWLRSSKDLVAMIEGRLAGQNPTNNSPLGIGWNLLGPTCRVETPYEQGVQGFIWHWNGDGFTHVARADGKLNVGTGYWVFAPTSDIKIPGATCSQ